MPINEIAERWIDRYDRERVRALSDLKRALEEPPVEQPEFVYTTYIRTTPERLWQALTDPAFTRRWWQTTFDTDWVAGSTMTWDNNGTIIDDPAQIVLESDPYRRLAYTLAHLHAGAERAQFGGELFASCPASGAHGWRSTSNRSGSWSDSPSSMMTSSRAARRRRW